MNFISVCPQINVLCDKMTVRENMIFFGKFKSDADLTADIDKYLEMFNLDAKANTLASNLSGGQKRKL